MEPVEGRITRRVALADEAKGSGEQPGSRGSSARKPSAAPSSRPRWSSMAGPLIY